MDAHTRNKKQAQEDVCIVILQYLWAQFRDEESPCSSAQHTHVDSDGLLKKFVAEINHAISKKKKSLTVAAVLLKPAVWHSYDESEEDRNQEHLPPDLLHLSSNSQSLSGWDTLALRPTLIWFGLTCPNNTDDDVPIAFYLH